MEENNQYSLSQRVHLTQKDLKKFLDNNIFLMLFGIGLVALIMFIAIPSISFIESFGHYEDHLNSSSGPLCNRNDYVNSNNFPAQILTVDRDAAKSGIKEGDIITSINGKTISNANDWKNWTNVESGIKPGDTVQVIVNRYGITLPFNVQTTSLEKDTSKAVIGIGVPDIPPTCATYFVLNKDTEFTGVAILLVRIQIWAVIIVTGFFGALLAFALAIWRPKIKKIKSELKEWENIFLDQTYILTFNTNRPDGNTNGEKIFNLAQKVFPELREPDGKFAKWQEIFVGKNSYEFDCYQSINTKRNKIPELFVAKHFGDKKITLDELQKACEAAKKNRNTYLKKNKMSTEYNKIFRFICVGKNYDLNFLEDESVEQTMSKLDFEFPIDLILEEKDGNYNVLWIDYE